VPPQEGSVLFLIDSGLSETINRLEPQRLASATLTGMMVIDSLAIGKSFCAQNIFINPL
jgi:hypothetical protein